MSFRGVPIEQRWTGGIKSPCPGSLENFVKGGHFLVARDQMLILIEGQTLSVYTSLTPSVSLVDHKFYIPPTTFKLQIKNYVSVNFPSKSW